MAILKRVALLPSGDECELAKLLSAAIEIRQSAPLYGNAPDRCYVLLRDGSWLLVRVRSKDVQFKFECLSLHIEKIAGPDPHTVPVARDVEIELQPLLLFRSEWHRTAAVLSDDAWKAICADPPIESVPLPNLPGCLMWWGVVLHDTSGNEYMICLDDFPLSIRVISDAAEIAEGRSRSREVPLDCLLSWRTSLSGWEVY